MKKLGFLDVRSSTCDEMKHSVHEELECGSLNVGEYFGIES